MPHKINNGALQLATRGAQLKKVIMIAAGSRENSNPWNQAGTVLPLFDTDSPRVRGLIRRGLSAHFERLSREGRAELVRVGFEAVDEGTLDIQIEYRDLVKRTVVATTVTISVGGG